MSPFADSAPTRLLTIAFWLGSVVATRQHLVTSLARCWPSVVRQDSPPLPGWPSMGPSFEAQVHEL